MNEYVLDCIVEGYQHLIPKLKLPDFNDRHVLAAAIQAKVSMILTYNLKDFPEKVLGKYKIKSVHPDDFISDLINLNLGVVCAEIKEARSSLKKPPVTVEQYLETLKKHSLPKTVKMLAMHSNLL